jgi:deoxyribose-phosphate aldolase
MEFERIKKLAEEIEKGKFGDLDLRGYIENTILKPEATPKEVEEFCRRSAEYGFYGVCVNPSFVSLARDSVGKNLRVISVVGFPLGATTTYSKVKEGERCIRDGADELDMVIHIGFLKGGEYKRVEEDIKGVVSLGVPVKVIIETSLLTDEEKVIACKISENAGAKFVKTSTGFLGGGATIYDVLLMKSACSLEVKASGGIREKDFAIKLIKAGATRLGTSRGFNLL